MQNEDVLCETVGMLNTGSSGGNMSVRYTEGVLTTGTMVSFREQFEVTTNTGVWPGDSANGFAIYLVDIRDAAGNSRLVSLDTESIKEMTEITAAFVYDYEKDILYVHGSGVYQVYIKVYAENGTVSTFEYVVPVEVGGFS